MTLPMRPPKLPLNLDNERNLPSVNQEVPKQNKGTVLFKTLSPRKRIDQYGLDQTDYKAYCLSSTVFPTAVKTTLLGDLQEVNPHTCGFDIVEKPAPGEARSLPSCATSVINAPPPTAVTSQRSAHSAPIVAFVEVPYSVDMIGTSVVSKSTAHSQSNSVVSVKRDHQVHNDHGDGVGHPPENRPRTTGFKDEQNEGQDEAVIHPDGYESAPRLSWSSGHNSAVVKMSHKFKKRSESRPTQKEASPRVTSYSRFDQDRLIRYNWKSREVKVEEEKTDGGDIRDTMYLNTFFPDERPVRFNKISLPRIGLPIRRRPWTVSESNVSARIGALAAYKQNNNFKQPHRASGKNCRGPWKGILKNSTNGTVSKSAGHISLRQNIWRESFDDGDKENDDLSLDKKPLLEIRSFPSLSAVGDQREKLKGKNGCLNSRVKQCIRFVRYRERLDKQDEIRPMKSEHGKYRPFSKTDVRDHNLSNPAPTPELKLQQSVETYQHYMENIARQTSIVSPKNDFSFRGGSHTTSFSRLRAPKTANSSNFDADSIVVQSVMDSNRPDAGVSAPVSRPSTETPRPQDSAIYTKDVSAVGQALDIKRISPVPTINRVVPGTRGVIQRSNSPDATSPHIEEVAGDAAEDVLSPMSSHHGATIVVPQASKSECPSEYSFYCTEQCWDSVLIKIQVAQGTNENYYSKPRGKGLKSKCKTPKTRYVPPTTRKSMDQEFKLKLISILQEFISFIQEGSREGRSSAHEAKAREASP